MSLYKDNLNRVLFIVLSLLIFEGCMPRQANGSYPKSVYSYHPYNKYHSQNSKHNRDSVHYLQTRTPQSYEQASSVTKVTPEKQSYNTAYNAFNRMGLKAAQPKASYYDSYSNQPVYDRPAQSTHRRVQSMPSSHQAASIQRIEQLAKAQLGKRYKWAADGPYAFDCSGFTRYVFADSGVNLPRVSYMQAKVGEFVPRNLLKKGDLIFFDNKHRTKINHTGIYLGNDQFIHASQSKKRVVISSLNKGYYQSHFMWGRRVVR